jgi:glycosyltransferase involved in cell wall biosynthesis
MKKCIWYISKYVAPPTSSGVGGRGYHLMEEMSLLGCKTVIIASDSNQLVNVPKLKKIYQHEWSDDIEMIWIKTLKYKVAKSFMRIVSWLDFEFKLLFLPKNKLPKPDAVIVSSLSILTILNGLLLRKKFNCKLIFEIRDIWPLTIVEEGGYSYKNPFVKILGWIEKIGYKKADLIVGTMPNLAEHVENILGYQKNVTCIPMGYNKSTIESQLNVSTAYIEKYIPKDKFIVAHAGTIGITNALDIFFECAQSMIEFENIHFLSIGDGDLRSYYENKYSKLTNLTFAPKVQKQMVQSVLSKCDLLYFSVHKSKVWQYGQSLNKIIDYMISGKPVVASFSGYPSMINEANSGSYVPAGDLEALKKEIQKYSTLSNEELSIIGNRGKEWIFNNRNYKRLAQDYLSAIWPSL